jgi:hypothetical protein
MKKINPEMFRSPQAVFVLYMLASFLVILGFRFIFPGETAPIPYFSKNWRLVRGALEILNLFPALALSALAVPFGMVSEYGESSASFSPKLFQQLVAPIITAICAAAAYGLVFFLVLPVFRDMEGNMRFKGELYRQAREEARDRAKSGRWPEASQFIGICESVWPGSPDIEPLKAEAAIRLEERRYAQQDEEAAARASLAANRAEVSALPGGRQPADTAEALAMGEAAYREERFWDAHWLATLGGRIARQGSPEAAEAARLAGRAWNRIESLEPNRREARLYSLYNLKQSGYEAMVSGDWIRAFYIFQKLIEDTPDDPDTVKFLGASEAGTREIAFFIDEMKVSLGDVLTGAVFSLPLRTRGGVSGRAVLRFASLSAFSDYAYATGLEYLVLDSEGRLAARLDAPYIKLLPRTIDGRPQVMALMQALDRQDSGRRWGPEWTLESGAQTAYRSLLGDTSAAGGTSVALNLSYENFLLLARMRRGLSALQIGELFSASKIIGEEGYIPQVFEAEILNRLGAALFFLPMTIAAIIIGWRYRARRRPRYLFVVMLPVLPLVFAGFVHLYRSVLNMLGITLIIGLGFSAALAIFIAAMAALFVLSLIILAAQHG